MFYIKILMNEHQICNFSPISQTVWISWPIEFRNRQENGPAVKKKKLPLWPQFLPKWLEICTATRFYHYLTVPIEKIDVGAKLFKILQFFDFLLSSQYGHLLAQDLKFLDVLYIVGKLKSCSIHWNNNFAGHIYSLETVFKSAPPYFRYRDFSYLRVWPFSRMLLLRLGWKCIFR